MTLGGESRKKSGKKGGGKASRNRSGKPNPSPAETPSDEAGSLQPTGVAGSPTSTAGQEAAAPARNAVTDTMASERPTANGTAPADDGVQRAAVHTQEIAGANSITPQVDPVATQEIAVASSTTPQVDPVATQEIAVASSTTPQVDPMATQEVAVASSTTPQVDPVATQEIAVANSTTPQVDPVATQEIAVASSTTPQADPVTTQEIADVGSTTPQADLGSVSNSAATGEVAALAEPTDAEKMAIVDAGYKRLCSDATLQSKKEGFFKTFDSQVIQSVSESQFEEFKKLKTDEERVFFVWQIPTVHSTVSVKPFSREKSARAAEESKKAGNNMFQLKKYTQAVSQYSRMVIRAPTPGDSVGGELLSLGHANRSAALLHMDEYRHCLRDIEAALKANYPRRLHYKLLDRRATCQLKLGEVTAARATLQELKSSLDSADLDQKKRSIWDGDVQKKIVAAAKLSDFKPIMLHMPDELPELPSRSEHFTSASAAVDVAYNRQEGRYAVAATAVAPGDVLVVEKPHASVLMSEKMPTHCLHCLKRVVVAFPCADCSGVQFCSPECVAAAAPYHRWECRILDVLQASGMSMLCHLALRIVTMHGVQFFQALRPELEKTRGVETRPATDADGRTFDPSSYLAVHQLAMLADLRKPEDFFHRALMSALMLKHLRVAGFFGDVGEEDAPERALTPDELLIGGLLLRHLQLLQFNAHEVGEYVMMEEGQYKQSRSVYIGVAVYPTVSFFNHSCEGGVSRCFVGDTLIIRSVQLLAAGDHIFENYGPTYTHKSLRDRQHWLSSRYWFDCRCVACANDWPDYDEYDNTKVTLRCPECGHGIVNDATGKDANGDCLGCGKKNNAVELFRQLHSVQELYQSAMSMVNEGEPRKALRLMYRHIEQSKQLVVAPNRDVSLCQEAARMCLASLGSRHCIKKRPRT